MHFLLATFLFINGYSFGLAIPYPDLQSCQAAPEKILSASEIPLQITDAQCVTAAEFDKMVNGTRI